MAEMEFMGFTNMTMTDIENVLNQYNKEKEASAGYRKNTERRQRGAWHTIGQIAALT